MPSAPNIAAKTRQFRAGQKCPQATNAYAPRWLFLYHAHEEARYIIRAVFRLPAIIGAIASAATRRGAEKTLQRFRAYLTKEMACIFFKRPLYLLLAAGNKAFLPPSDAAIYAAAMSFLSPTALHDELLTP